MKRMKAIFTTCVAVVAISGASFAQTLDMMPIGEMIRPDGSRAYVVPATSVVVDITAAKEVVKTGPYARFAQKYLGVIAPLADKETYSLLSAKMTYFDSESRRHVMPGELPSAQSSVFVHTGSADEFPRVLPDRRDATGKNVEEAAADAAKTIFSLRKRRAELVTGEYAETVYGAGLQAAIERIDKMENEYLELFFGKQVTTQYTMRYTVTPISGDNTTVVCRFREDSGLMPANDLSGEPVLLECRPEGLASSIYPPDRRRTAKPTDLEYAVADMVNCRIMSGKRELGSASIPMFQYGVKTIFSVK